MPEGFYFGINTTSYEVTTDDQRFLTARAPGAGGPDGQGELILVQNFFEEVRQRVGR